MNCQKTNGRGDLISPDTSKLFSMFDSIPVAGKPTSYRSAMVGNWYDTDLSNSFFCSKNIERLQDDLKKGVYEASNGQYVIDRQNNDELKIVMRGIFLIYARNLPNGVQKQIETLNNKVLDYCVPQVLGEAQGYVQYTVDASTMYSGGSALIPPPAMTTDPDRTALEFKSWF